MHYISEFGLGNVVVNADRLQMRLIMIILLIAMMIGDYFADCDDDW